MTEEKKKPRGFFDWFFFLVFLPISLTIWFLEKKDWSKSKKIKAIAIVWAFFIIFGLVNESEARKRAEAALSAPVTTTTTTATPRPVENKVDENAVINQELADKRKAYDTDRGNNTEAAVTAQAMVDLSNAVSPGMEFDVYIKLSANDKATKKYDLGGDEQEYRNEVSFVGLSIIIDSSVWASSTDDQKKNLISAWAKIMENQYPKAGGWLNVDNGFRSVAEATWLGNGRGYDPEIKLK